MKITNMKASSASGTKTWLSKTKTLLVALALLVASPTLLFAVDLSGRYAIGSATHTGKFLRGLPEQQSDVVTADAPKATVFLVKAEKDGTYSLQSHAFFLSIEGGEHDAVMHKANASREKFKIVDNGDGTFSLMAVWNKKYLTVDKDGNVHSSATNGADAKFKLHKK